MKDLEPSPVISSCLLFSSSFILLNLSQVCHLIYEPIKCMKIIMIGSENVCRAHAKAKAVNFRLIYSLFYIFYINMVRA